MAERSTGGFLRAGFSLIELMLVIIVIGMIAGAVAMSMDAVLPRSQLNSAVRALAATLQGTRSEAIGRNAEFLIEYDLDAEAYRVISPFLEQGGLVGPEDEDDEERIELAWQELDSSVEIASVYIGEDQIHEGIARVRFDPLGASSGHAVVFVQPMYENYYTIEVLALTGLIHFHEGLFLRELPDESEFR